MAETITVALDADTAALRAALDKIGGELRRRDALVDAAAQIEAAQTAASQALGRKDGDAWVQPTGAHDSYRLGAIVTHGGKRWINVVPVNVWAPGVAGWREQTADGSPAAWTQPSGAVDAYRKGDKVTYQGATYTSLVDGNGWPPTIAVAWAKDGASSGGGSGGVKAWDPIAYPYKVGDRVTYQGATYECLQAHTSQAGWAPAAVPSLWKKL